MARDKGKLNTRKRMSRKRFEKKTPKAFSEQDSIWDRFCFTCYNLPAGQSSPSAEIQKFIKKFLKKNEEGAKKKNEQDNE